MPHIGLLSDSHGRAPATRQAVDLLRDAGAEILIHLGDVGNEAVIDALADEIPAYLVFGNTDYDVASLQQYAQHLGITVRHPVGRLALENGETLVYQHGDLYKAMDAAIEQKARYLCHGHTHVPRDERVGDTRVINPGALHRAARYTVALLDTDRDALKFLTVPARPPEPRVGRW